MQAVNREQKRYCTAIHLFGINPLKASGNCQNGDFYIGKKFLMREVSLPIAKISILRLVSPVFVLVNFGTKLTLRPLAGLVMQVQELSMTLRVK